MLISPGRSNLGERLKETFFGLLLCIRKKEGRQQLLCLVTAFPKVTHPATAGARTGLPGVGFRLMYIWSTPPRSVGSQQCAKRNQSLKPRQVPSETGLWVTPNASPPASQTNAGCRCGGKGTFTELSGFCHPHVKKGCLVLPRVSLASRFQLQMKQTAKCLRRNLPGLCPGPDLGPASWPLTCPDGVKAPRIGAELCHGALERRKP